MFLFWWKSLFFFFLFSVFCSRLSINVFQSLLSSLCLARCTGTSFKRSRNEQSGLLETFPSANEQAPLVPLISAEWKHNSHFQTNDVALTSCTDREGTLATVLFLFSYWDNWSVRPCFTWIRHLRGSDTAELSLCCWEAVPSSVFKMKKKATSAFPEARCQTQSSDHELTLPQLTDTGFSQWTLSQNSMGVPLHSSPNHLTASSSAIANYSRITLHSFNFTAIQALLFLGNGGAPRPDGGLARQLLWEFMVFEDTHDDTEMAASVPPRKKIWVDIQKNCVWNLYRRS